MTPLKIVIIGMGIIVGAVVLWALVESIVMRIRLNREAEEGRRRLAEGMRGRKAKS